MNRIIKIFTVFILALLLCTSCSDNMDMQSVEKSNISMLMHRVDSINSYYIKVYGTSNVQSVVRKSTLDTDTTQQQANHQEIFRADAVGFYVGAVLGAEEGYVIGTFIYPGMGTIFGAVAEAISAGISLGALCSIWTARNNNCIALQNAEPSLNMEEWIHSDPNILFEDELVGGNVGWYHNDIIRAIWSNSLYNSSSEELLENIAVYLEDNHIVEYEDRELFISVLHEQWSMMPDNFYNNENIEYQLIVEGYMETMAQIDEDARFAYTHSMMEEISQFGLEEVDTYLLNGTISTYYYSSQLWNIEAIFNFPHED